MKIAIEIVLVVLAFYGAGMFGYHILGPLVFGEEFCRHCGKRMTNR